MALRLSTGFWNKVLGTGSVQTVLAGGTLDIYSGAQPAAADDAPTGTLLASITITGTGLNMDPPVNNVISKAAAEAWTANAAATGTAGWFRYKAAGDTGVVSTTEARVDGAIAVSGAEMNISHTAVTAGAAQTVNQFDLTFPLV